MLTSAADFDGDGRPDRAVLNVDNSFDSQRTGDVVVLPGRRDARKDQLVGLLRGLRA